MNFVESEERSWNGTTPTISSEYLPISVPKFNFSSSFVNNFNKNPLDTFKKEIENNQKIKEAEYAAQYLFYCYGLQKSALMNFIFSNNIYFKPENFLFLYFSCICMEYISLTDSLYLCLSRIAFPNDKEQLNIIFNSFARCYQMSNPYLKLSLEDIILISKVAIIVSGYHISNNNNYPNDKFMQLLKRVEISDQQKNYFYEKITKKPIPLFFTFGEYTEAPNYKKKGMLKKIGGFFKSKKDRMFAIDDFVLKYYHDKSMKEEIGEIDIGGTISSYEPPTKKTPDYLIIKNKDNTPIGFKISKEGQRKKSNHMDYIAYGDSSNDLKEWAKTLNILSFWKIMFEIIEPPDDKKQYKLLQ